MLTKTPYMIALFAIGVLPFVTIAVGPADRSLPDHPRLLISRADLPALKEKIAKHAWARRTLTAFRQRADAWLARPVALPDRGGQWSHWYSCKKHGARLRTESPTRHVCPIDGEVYTGYPYDDVVLSREHDANADAVRNLGLVYLLTDEPKYAVKAREVLLAYADRYLTYPLHNNQGREAVGGGRVTSQTLNEAIWIIRMAQGADCIWDRLSNGDREKLESKLFYPAVNDVIRKHRMGIHNIQCWKNSAVGLVGFLFDDRDLIADAIDSAHGFRQQMTKGVNADGQWWEGAWGYHFYTMDAVWPLTEAARNCGINLYGDEYKRMFTSPILLAMPDGTLPAFNDSETATAYGNPNYEIGFARYGDKTIARAIGGGRDSLQALLYGVGSVPGANETRVGSGEYPASGYTILRSSAATNPSWLCLKYGPHGGGHGHPDKNSFVLFAGGSVLAGDPGRAAYGVPIQSEWYRTTLAHNTLVVDETSQSPTTGRAIALEARATDWKGAICDAGPALAGLRFRRSVALLDDHVALFVDQIVPDRDIATASARTLDLAYHPDGVWADLPVGEPVDMPDKPGYKHVRDAKATALAAAPKSGTAPMLHLQTRRKSSQGAWWITVLGGDVPTRAIIGTGVGANTEDRVPMVIFRRVAAATTYIWAVGLKPDVRPELAAEALTTPTGGTVPAHTACAASVRFTPVGSSSPRTWWVVANPDGIPIRLRQVTTSARLSAQRMRP